MKVLSLSLYSVGLLLLAACGDDTGGAGGGSGGSGGAGGGTTSATTTATTTTTTTGAGGEGGDGATTGSGGAGGEGEGGGTGGGGGTGPVIQPACEVPAEPPSAGACVTVGGPGVPCNPVNGDGCDLEAGESCDFDPPNEAFMCYPPPNGQDPCEECPGPGDSFCSAGSTCDFAAGVCAKFCCDDADCGEGNVCLKDAGAVAEYGYVLRDAPVGACYPAQ